MHSYVGTFYYDGILFVLLHSLILTLTSVRRRQGLSFVMITIIPSEIFITFCFKFWGGGGKKIPLPPHSESWGGKRPLCPPASDAYVETFRTPFTWVLSLSFLAYHTSISSSKPRYEYSVCGDERMRNVCNDGVFVVCSQVNNHFWH